MTILQRIKRIISANINSLIDKAEDPETMLNQLIREMDESIIALRAEVAKAIAGEKRISRRINDTEKSVQVWQENSEKAVRDGCDDLARKALERRLQEQDKLPDLRQQHRKALNVCASLKEQLRVLEDKVQDARRKKEILVVRKRTAQAQQAILSATQTFSHAARRSDSLLTQFDVTMPVSVEFLEDEVIQLEADVEALGEAMGTEPSLEQVFEKSKAKERIDRELEELKRKVNQKL